MTVIDEIAAERKRQIEVMGWGPEHNDAHKMGEIAGAAACYLMNSVSIGSTYLKKRTEHMVRDLWPWAPHWWHPKDRRSDLIKAACLIVAEIERLDRMP